MDVHAFTALRFGFELLIHYEVVIHCIERKVCVLVCF